MQQFLNAIIRTQTTARMSYLFVFLILGMIHLADLCQLRPVVGVLNGILRRVVLPGRHRLWRGRDGTATVLRTSHALRYQHVVQSEQLRVSRVIFLQAADAQPCTQAATPTCSLRTMYWKHQTRTVLSTTLQFDKSQVILVSCCKDIKYKLAEKEWNKWSQ